MAFSTDEIDHTGFLDSEIDDEIAVLKSIYEEKLIIEENNEEVLLSMMVYPATADDTNSQFVRVLLQLTISKQCRDLPVKPALKSSRGLSDKRLQTILSALTHHAQNNVGSCVLFDLIEMTKDSLTLNNIPSSPCPICLAEFQDFDDFVKTTCFHYVHSYCLYQYMTYWKNENDNNPQPQPLHFDEFRPNTALYNQSKNAVPCPICREPVSFELEVLANSSEPVEPKVEKIDLSGYNLRLREMKIIYNKQKEKGGIIDLEAEKNKFLLSTLEQAYTASLSSSSNSTLGHPEERSSDPEIFPIVKSMQKVKVGEGRNNVRETSIQHKPRKYYFHQKTQPSIHVRKPDQTARSQTTSGLSNSQDQNKHVQDHYRRNRFVKHSSSANYKKVNIQNKSKPKGKRVDNFRSSSDDKNLIS